MKPRRKLLTLSGSWCMERDTAAIVAVARTLRQLLQAEPPFHVISSLRGERGDVDHLAVGPTGVFAVETCSDKASQEEQLRRARRGAGAVRERLRRRGFDVTVQAVVCLPFADLDRPQYVDGVIVTRREHLDYLIRHWPGQRLSDSQSARVFAALQPRVHRAAA